MRSMGKISEHDFHLNVLIFGKPQFEENWRVERDDQTEQEQQLASSRAMIHKLALPSNRR